MKKILLITTVLTNAFILSGAHAEVLTVNANKTVKTSATYDYFNVNKGYLLVSGNGTVLTLTDTANNSSVGAGAYLILRDKSEISLASGTSLLIEGALTAGGSPTLYGTVSANDPNKYFFSKTKYDSAALPSASTITGNVTFNNAASTSNVQKNILIGSVLSVKTNNNEMVDKYDYDPDEYAKMVAAGTIKEYDIPALLTITGDLTLQKSSVEFKDKSYLEVSGAVGVTGESSLSGVINMKATSFDVKSGGVLSLKADSVSLDGKIGVESGGVLKLAASEEDGEASVKLTQGASNAGTFEIGDSAGKSKTTLTLADETVFTNTGSLIVNENSYLDGRVNYSDGTTVGTISGAGTIRDLYVNQKGVKMTDIFTGTTHPFVTNLYLTDSAEMGGNEIFFNYLQGNGAYSLSAGDNIPVYVKTTFLGLNGTTLDLNTSKIINASETLTVAMNGATLEGGRATANIELQGGENTLENVVVAGNVVNQAEATTTINSLIFDLSLNPDGKLTNAGKLDITGELNGEVVHDGGTISGTGELKKLTINEDAALSGVVSDSLGVYQLNIASGYTVTYDQNAKMQFKSSADTTGKLTGGGTLSLAKNVSAGNYLEVTGSGLNLNTYTFDNGTSDILFDSSSTLYVTVNGANDGQFGRLKAGTITADSGAKLVLTVKNNIWEKGVTKELQLVDGATGFSDNFTIADSVRYKIERTATAGVYAITYYYSSADIAAKGGANEDLQNASLLWDDVPFTSTTTVQGKISSALYYLSNTAGMEKDYATALASLAPQTIPVALIQSVDASVTAMNTVSQRISGRMSVGAAIQNAKRNEFNRRYGYRGRSGGNPMLTQGVWAQGLVNKSKYDVTNGFDSTLTGVAGGYDRRTQYGLAGVAAAFSKLKTHETAGRKTDASLHSVILYGAYRPNNFFIDGMLTGTYGAYSEAKNVYGVNVDADYNVYAAGAQATIGYDYRGFSPLLSARYFHAWQEDYTDAAGQKVSSDKSQTATIAGGLKYAPVLKSESDVFVIPYAQVLATYDFITPDKNKSVVNIGGGTYTILETGDGLSRSGVEASAGVTVDFGAIEASARYDGRFKKDYTSHTGMLEFRYNFVF